MLDLDDRLFAQRLRVMQIVTLAIIMGAVMFLGIAGYLVYGQRQGEGIALPSEGLPMLTLIAVALLVTNVPISWLLPEIVTRRAMGQIAAGTWQIPPGLDSQAFASDAIKLLAVRQTALIVGLALLESAAFMAGIAFLMEARVYVLALAAIAMVLMLLRFPTESGLRVWLEMKLDHLKAMRQHQSSFMRGPPK